MSGGHEMTFPAHITSLPPKLTTSHWTLFPNMSASHLNYFYRGCSEACPSTRGSGQDLPHGKYSTLPSKCKLQRYQRRFIIPFMR
ncbi:hypothetical protein E2C01_017536 [Portunus trituberculatus]|uniref:Uncharacterized protein n=1 Tax=Portunus trituberculatus TaxID=210409 RepID=A0A5B7DT48_PORTR|nr:hypothetical protein [Portunus trituberculatus]